MNKPELLPGLFPEANIVSKHWRAKILFSEFYPA